MKLYHVGPDKDPLHGSREAAKVAIALRETGADFEIEYLNRIRDMRPQPAFTKPRSIPWALSRRSTMTAFGCWSPAQSRVI